MISVLYIDDEAALLDITRMYMEKTGEFSVDTAVSGPLGLEKIRQGSYDAVVSDYQMPVMDGIELLKIVRREIGPIPFLLFTGKGREEIVIEAFNHGTDFYIQKGGSPKAQYAELMHKIRSAVQRHQSENALRRSEERYRILFENMLEGFAYCRMLFDENNNPVDFIYLDVNSAFNHIIGTAIVTGKRVTEVFPGIREDFPQIFEIYGRVALTGIPESFDLDFTPSHKWLHISVYSPEREHFVSVFEDITNRKMADIAVNLSNRIYRIANVTPSLKPMLKSCVKEFQALSGCEAVGIRILDDEGNIPYQAYTGFPDSFYEGESPLSVKNDECMCIYVIRGTANPDLPVISPNGSFYCNATTRFLASVPAEEKGRTRNVCNQMGYESIALIPIKTPAGIIGLIQLNDHRENMVPYGLVAMMEEVAPALGEVVRHLLAEDALRESLQKCRQLSDKIAD